MRRGSAIVVSIACLGALLACNGARMDPKFWIPSERRQKIEEAAEAYGYSLRWGKVDAAAAWVHPDHRAAFVDAVEARQSALRFTRFELRNIELGPERDQAQVLVSFELYRLPSIQERTIVEQQVWRYDGERWLVEPDLALYLGDVSTPPR